MMYMHSELQLLHRFDFSKIDLVYCALVYRSNIAKAKNDKERKYITTYYRLKLAYETNYYYKYEGIQLIFTETKTTVFVSLKIHNNDLNACNKMMVEVFYKHEVHN